MRLPSLTGLVDNKDSQERLPFSLCCGTSDVMEIASPFRDFHGLDRLSARLRKAIGEILLELQRNISQQM